jgi:hypothetical protein
LAGLLGLLEELFVCGEAGFAFGLAGLGSGADPFEFALEGFLAG